MIDSPADLARRLRRDVRAHKHASRYWAGWRLELTFGPYDAAFAADPERLRLAREVTASVWEQAYGSAPPTGPEEEARAIELQKDTWHLSASWRGGHPVEDGKQLLADLVAALGVPEDKRDGYQMARVVGPHGPSPQVTHWVWKDAP